MAEIFLFLALIKPSTRCSIVDTPFDPYTHADACFGSLYANETRECHIPILKAVICERGNIYIIF